MESMDNFRERFEALEQQTEQLKHQTHALEAHTCPSERRRRWWPTAWHVTVVAALGLALVLPHGVQAKTFRCSAGDVPCLIDAINQANANGEANTIRLAAGIYTLTLPDSSDPRVGLPDITSSLTLTGRGADTTIIERDASAPGFGILLVATGGTLTLKRLTLRGGTGFVGEWGGIRNEGTLTLVHTTVTSNRSVRGVGGISNTGTLALVHSAVTSNRGFMGGIATGDGTVTIAHSTIADNVGNISGGLGISGGTVTLHATTVTRNGAQGAAGINNGGFGGTGGAVIITKSAITQNLSDNAAGVAGILNGSTMVITNTTVSANRNDTGVLGRGPGGILNSGGTLLLTNSTLADNRGGIGGIRQEGGIVLLLNTILAQNISRGGPDCVGSITSLGTNLIGDPTGCTITLQPSDLTGNPGLDTFTDNGRPGNGHFPLLPTSQAIDAGNDAVCPRTDQLGRRRLGPCDIGAIEFRDRDDGQHDEEDDEPDADPAAMAQGA
jgi:hypothetical protein